MRRSRVLLSSLALMLCAGAARAQFGVGSAFTYQGQLSVSGAVANGTYDIQFRLLDSFTGGSQVGPVIVASSVSVTKGLFTKQLDFGASAINGSARWLELAVRPAGAGSFTVLSPLQPLTAAPYALGLSIPCTESNATASTLLSLTQTAANGAGAVSGTVLNGTGTAVYGQASGVGSTGVWGYNLSTAGYAGFFRTENISNASAAVEAQSVGVGPAVEANSSNGIAGKFDITNSPNNNPAVRAATAGTGSAGFFQNTNAANATATVYSLTNGTNDALASVTTGTGRAGLFTILNASSGAAALEATTSGFGYAGKFDGPVRVTGNLDAGNVTTSYTTGGQHRAAPVAFGQFSILQAATSTSNSSGNVTVSYMGNDLYRVNVLGGTNPTTWTVVGNICYGSPDNPGITYQLRVGTPDAGGHILFYAPCDSNCGGFGVMSTVSYAVYAP
jgi:hypothetical protein